jgi:hypothetical protein
MAFERKTIRIFYEKLLAFYPRAFREQFGESMEQTFNDVCRERIRQAKRLSFGFALWLFAETFAGAVRENLAEIKRGKSMGNLFTNQKSAAIIGFLLAMPLAILLLIEVFNIEPLSGFFRRLTTEADGHSINALGRILTIGAVSLLPAAFAVNFIPIWRKLRAGYSIAASPVNLLLALSLFIFIAGIVIANIVDQYPCWIGVPNCD